MRGTDGRYVGRTWAISGMICFVSPPKKTMVVPTSNDPRCTVSAKECASGRYR